MDKHYALDLDEGGYLANRKTTIESMNLSSRLIKENKEKMFSKIFYVFSLIFAVLIAVFSNSLDWLMVLLFIDISLSFLVWFGKDYSKQRKILAKDHYKIINRLKEFEINVEK